ncbi:fimbrial protein [Janthinobacterium sp. EB271-G4-7A]|uniref:fimbrial protein n=1 Tax=Janthinobacterium sp. EB271-G4-7A TaxID=2775056 RepID=UPI001E3A1FB6|nr:fimbrial protein [Janthinobacterium sp. EB271-G4-7A]MCC7697799.1 type 1 fimbrial protein [Janthinobacterium sp. EB271-G4-7A]
MKIRTMAGLMAGLLLCAAPQLVQAAPNCFAINGNLGFTGTMALQLGSLAVPRDVPNGTMLYFQYFSQAANGLQLQCDAPNAAVRQSFRMQGVGANANFSGNQAYAGKVYATRVPGIGVAWFANGKWMTDGNVDTINSNPSPYICGGDGAPPGTCNTKLLDRAPPSTSFALIKTGPVGAGIIRARDLGSVSYFATVNGGSTEFIITSIGLTGSISVVSSTCRTPDVKVALGSRKVSALTGAAGTPTPTVSFVLGLTDCPGFPGNFHLTQATSPMSSENGVVRDPSFLPNSVSVRIDPAAPAIDAARGVLSLTTERGVATGVGVQLLDSAGAPWPLSKDVKLSNVLAAGTRSLDISLGARYLKTTPGKVTAGPANAVATYTLTYQ